MYYTPFLLGDRPNIFAFALFLSGEVKLSFCRKPQICRSFSLRCGLSGTQKQAGCAFDLPNRWRLSAPKVFLWLWSPKSSLLQPCPSWPWAIGAAMIWVAIIRPRLLRSLSRWPKRQRRTKPPLWWTPEITSTIVGSPALQISRWQMISRMSTVRNPFRFLGIPSWGTMSMATTWKLNVSYLKKWRIGSWIAGITRGVWLWTSSNTSPLSSWTHLHVSLPIVVMMNHVGTHVAQNFPPAIPLMKVGWAVWGHFLDFLRHTQFFLLFLVLALPKQVFFFF